MGIDISVLMGVNIVSEVVVEKFCEIIIGEGWLGKGFREFGYFGFEYIYFLFLEFFVVDFFLFF